jgi:hypothetical protein
LPAPLHSAGSFDALEILNGYWANGDAESSLLADWFYLLSQGHRVTALGNSDTHKINWVRAGWPRSWLRLPTDFPGLVSGSQLADAIRKNRAIASTGPFVRLAVDQAQVGDLVVPHQHGRVTVDVTVDAPQWITVDTVRIYVNGNERQKFSVKPGARPVFSTSLTEPITSDSWIVVLATGATPLSPDIVGEVGAATGQLMLPWAVTNPVFIDADGNGDWTPPTTWSPISLPLPLVQLPSVRRQGIVPLDCDPSAIETEPPLNALASPARTLMPLLYP